MFSTVAFVSECIPTDMTLEWFLPRVFPVVIILFGLRLKTLLADITDKLAITRVKFRMTPKEIGLFKTSIASRILTGEWFCRPCGQ